MRAVEQHFNVQFLGGGAVDSRFQFSVEVDFKRGLERLPAF